MCGETTSVLTCESAAARLRGGTSWSGVTRLGSLLGLPEMTGSWLEQVEWANWLYEVMRSFNRLCIEYGVP